MNDEEKLNDFRTRKDRYAFDGNTIKSLLERARKKGRMQEMVQRSLRHENIEEGVMYVSSAKIIGVNGTSVLMELYAVADQGVDCLQYFAQDEFQKRFVVMGS